MVSLISPASNIHTQTLEPILSGLVQNPCKSSVFYSDRESKVPVPPAGHRWKEVRHDNTVTWLASWTENIQGAIKYVMLNANSKLKVKKKKNIYIQSLLVIH